MFVSEVTSVMLELNKLAGCLAAGRFLSSPDGGFVSALQSAEWILMHVTGCPAAAAAAS